jgi:hypothetical protein
MGNVKFAGKAFIGGMFGSLGVAIAILGTGAILARVGERVIRNAIREQEANLKAAYEKMKETEER